MAKKFDSVIDALNQINQNTLDTKNSVRDLILNDKKLEEQRKRDEIAADKEDRKKESSILKGISNKTGATNAGKGFIDSILSTLGMAGGIVGLTALMQNFDLLKEGLDSLIKGISQASLALATLPVLNRIIDKPSTKKTVPTSRLDTKGATPKKTQIDVPETPSVLKDKPNTLNFTKEQKQSVAAELTKNKPTVMTDIGELKVENTGIRDVKTGRYVNVDNALDAMVRSASPSQLSAAGIADNVPKIPEPPKAPTIPDAPSQPKAPKPTGDSFLKKAASAAGDLPGVQMIKGVGKALPGVGLGIDIAQGYFDDEMKKAGYGAMDRGGISLIEGTAELGDAGVNALTALYGGAKGLFNGDGLWTGLKQGWNNNDIDMSQMTRDFALSESGKYIYSLGRMGTNPLTEIGNAVTKSRAERNQNFFTNEDKLMSQDWARPNLGLNSTAQAVSPEQVAKLKYIGERNSLYSEILNTDDAQKRDELLEKLTDLVELMQLNGNAGMGQSMLNNINNMVANNTVLPTKTLSIETPDVR